MSENHTEEDRRTTRDNWIQVIEESLDSDDDFKKYLGLEYIRQMWEYVGQGSGTIAEVLSRLTANGYGEVADKVKELSDMGLSGDEISKSFGIDTSKFD